ncbi:hypothetical protein MD484_g7250, partial [Candolleomyces efflorescens]
MLTRSSSKKSATTTPDPTFEEQKRLIRSELVDAISLESDSFTSSLYHQVASESAIDRFLKKSRFYSVAQRRWKLPHSYTKLIDQNFYTPFLNVFSAILKGFSSGSTSHVTREVVDTHTIGLQHREANSVVHHSHPSLVIKAEGPSFQRPYTDPGKEQKLVGYPNITTCIDIYVDGKEPSMSDQLAKAGIYARQIFIHQPNRRFVRVLVLTEEHVRLFHFDRSGAQYTPPLNFHDNPHTFVRLVLGLSSVDESDIGLDASIQWITRREHGRKVGGTLRARGPNGEDVFYKLSGTTPFFCDDSIRGRCTMCWNVRDPVTNEALVVKDSWRTEERLSEHLFMQNAVGIPGVAQMVSCEPDRCDTMSFRGFGDVVPAGFRNRIETRIVMKAYGTSIRKYTSAKQLFCALRDAIAGHMELFKRGTIHRDVSLQNVLLGKPGAVPGDRGILIDFDIATLRHLNTPATRHMGTRSYQSIPVLYSAQVPHPLPHDHLDDLESFLYVLAHIMFARDSAGVDQGPDQMLLQWEQYQNDWRWLGTFKEAYLTRRHVPFKVLKRWPSPCVDLILAYAGFMQPLVQEKLCVSQLKPGVRSDKAEAFAANFNEHYTHILTLFDTAIEALDHPDTWEVVSDSPDADYDPRESSDSVPTIIYLEDSSSSESAGRPSLKRSNEDPSGQPPTKRSKSTSGRNLEGPVDTTVQSP